jgi:hypothetical protein
MSETLLSALQVKSHPARCLSDAASKATSCSPPARLLPSSTAWKSSLLTSPIEPQPFRVLSGPLALPLQRVVLVVVAAAVFLLVVVAGLDEREGLAGVVHGGSLA